MCGAFMMSLLAVSLGGAEQVAGIVQDLQGSPLAGAVVRNSRESDTTNASGLWILGKASLHRRFPPAPIPPDIVRPVRLPGTGEVRFLWGISPDGRRDGRTSPAAVERRAAARMWAPNPSVDTLEVLWKDVVRTRLPLGPSDASFMAVRIDTSSGIPLRRSP